MTSTDISNKARYMMMLMINVIVNPQLEKIHMMLMINVISWTPRQSSTFRSTTTSATRFFSLMTINYGIMGSGIQINIMVVLIHNQD